MSNGRGAMWAASVFILFCLVDRSVGSSAAGVYSETEEGQLDAVTNNGAVVSETNYGQEREDEKKIEQYDLEDWNIIREQLLQQGLGPEDTADNPLRRRRDLSRHRRFLTNNKNLMWPKGIVPYDFHPELSLYYQKEALAAMTKFEKFTCIRFVPWVLNETKTKYGLSLESHVTISKGNGCAAHQGNIRRASGQYNSCCGRGTCIHELGHTLGLWHEHQNPAAEGIMELNWKKISPDWAWTYRWREPQSLMICQYDTTDTMHYGGSAFEILYEDLRKLMTFSSQYYMYKDVSLFHDCQGLYCSDFTQECYNGGFVTKVNDQCSCLCPAGLDPGTSCQTPIKEVTTSSVWPAGSYGLMSPKAGCPADGSVFSQGSWTHKGEGGNSKSSSFNLAGTFDADSFRYEFCVKEDSSVDGPAWEPGRYCILRAGGQCPEGFSTGSIQFEDADDSPQNSSGKLPDGVFAEDTLMEFCCRNDGFSGVPLINVPNKQPLVLLPYTGDCQQVAGHNNAFDLLSVAGSRYGVSLRGTPSGQVVFRSVSWNWQCWKKCSPPDGKSTIKYHCLVYLRMHSRKEYMRFESFPDKAAKNGSTPYVHSGTTFKIRFCYYVPAKTDCGGRITLTRDNREAVITSPNYPSTYGVNTRCTWVINAAEPNSRVLLNVNDMKLTSEGSSCQDSLEIRYNLPGQPGIRYCGNGLSRTIRSLNDTVLLTLRTDHQQVAADIGFNITASIHIPEEDECFEPSTKGKLYRGLKNYTRSMRPCLDWKEVTSCPHHAFKPVDSGAGLDENYCRNPDNTDMPWCYTDINDCKRDYCDVCNIERIYDRAGFCTQRSCNQTRDKIIALGCAATCNLEHPPTLPRSYTCEQPHSVRDADRVNKTCDGEYQIGDTVDFKCFTGDDTVTQTCMSDGNFSPAGYACGACPDYWAYFKGACYRYFNNRVNWITAQSSCRSHGGFLSSMRDKEEQDFIGSLNREKWVMWNGANDKEVEGTFVWDDGTPVNWTNWDKNTPNNYANQDCVEVYAFWDNHLWNDISCNVIRSFACQRTLSERKVCVDRHPDCLSILLEKPDTCSAHPAFANQMCPYTCAACEPDSTARCQISTSSSGIVVVSPEGQTSVGRGASVQYACTDGYALTSGQLNLACSDDGSWIGQTPTCEDANTIIQESNGAELRQRSKTLSARRAYLSLGDSLGIFRYGVIKQWKFFSPSKGFVFFMVWRPNPAGGNFSFNLVGKNQVLTSGYGEETYDVPEADWIHVQPGDRLSVFEGPGPRAWISYDNCNKAVTPEDYGVIWSNSRKYHAEFSPSMAHQFSSGLSCLTFSFKAVIHPNTTVPAHPQLPTSQEAIVGRSRVGSGLYMTDSANAYIPAYGWVSEWQFYSRNSGTASFQVWRRRSDLGVRHYEFIGENKVNVTTPSFNTVEVPVGERIAVKTGDLIALEYGENGYSLQVPYSFCSASANPESYNTYWCDRKGRPLEQGLVCDFRYTGGGYLCRTFSFRAIVTQNKAAEDKECFDPDTKGALYRGQKNYTRTMKPCLPWTQVTACPHHTFQASDFGDGLEKNYCRRPDNELDMPWCYTDSNCQREYCDVCNDDPVVDTATSCSDDVCDKSDLEILTAGCAATCNLQSPPAPIRTQQCGQPDSIPGSSIVDQEAASAYNVGDTVTYRCDQGEGNLTRTCLSDGQWSPGGYVCTATCADRYAECPSMLLKLPDVCATHTDFARQMCPYSCGVCQSDSTPRCSTDVPGDAVLVSPAGQQSVARGTAATYACPDGYALSEGKLVLACGEDGNFIGELPVCNDVNTLVQESNHVKLSQRSKTLTSGRAYLSFGDNLGIFRYGVIKQWKFFSPSKGWVFFMVWRPNLAGGNFSFNLVGKTQVMTSGTGEETYDVAEADWIYVQPGDRISILEGPSPRAWVPYDNCNKATNPEDFGVSWGNDRTNYAEFSPNIPHGFSTTLSCLTFSFKAVIYPNSTVPANRKLPTSQVTVLTRSRVGSSENVYMVDSNVSYIPVDGFVSEWQFYVKHAGSAGFQVWRRRSDLGVRKYELIGQNALNLTEAVPHLHTLTVPAGERIAVKAGDIIAVLYDKNQLGVPYDFCSQSSNPESYNVYWYEFMTPATAEIGKVQSFSYTGGSYLCRMFSMRAIVTPQS